jgi:hypothetical protein
VSRIKVSRVAVRYVLNLVRHLAFARRPAAAAPSHADRRVPAPQTDRV